MHPDIAMRRRKFKLIFSTSGELEEQELDLDDSDERELPKDPLIKMLTSGVRQDLDEFITQEPRLKVIDVVEKMIDTGLVTGRITNFISNMREHSNLRKLFVLFAIKRNFILINFLF